MQLRSLNPDDNAFIRALDNALRPGVDIKPWTGFITIHDANDLKIHAIAPYILYRSNLMEAMRKFEPIDSVYVPSAVAISVHPSRIDAPDIIKIVVERDGKMMTPLASTSRRRK